MNNFIDDLLWRGMFHQATDLAGLREHLATGKRRAYIGLDPTADSLTIGNLATVMLLAHFQRAGHEPIVLAGGGTGLIGDPGGKSAERPLLSLDQVRSNVESQKRIYSSVLPGATVLNNADWLVDLSYVSVLRDVGKYFSVNEMVKRDSVRNRLEGDGISYTEFSYMVLQSYDFQHLFSEHGVSIQMGGSDQWGNIVSGVDLVRRMHGATAFALTGPLIVKADGTKFGKSESGAIWLTLDRTSAYAFHQFWLNTDDADVIGYLKRFTFLDRDAIESLEVELTNNPGQRSAQRTLASEVTTMLHGINATRSAENAGKALFSGDIRGLDNATLDAVFANVPSSTHQRESLRPAHDLVELLIQTKLATSKREAREFIANGSVLINGIKAMPETALTENDLLFGTTIALRRGKRNWHVTRWV